MIGFRKLGMTLAACVLAGSCTQTAHKPNHPADEWRDGQCVATPPAGWSAHGSVGEHYEGNADESISAMISAMRPITALTYGFFARPTGNKYMDKHDPIVESGNDYVVHASVDGGKSTWNIYINSEHLCSLMVQSKAPVDYTKVVRPILMTLREEPQQP